MWLKLCLLLLYIVVLFIVARLLEAIAFAEIGLLSQRLLDPMTLSVLKLKALLDSRGVNYEGVVEKRELTDLIENTGHVSQDELDLVVRETEAGDDEEETIFTSGSHFFEQVEDAKDSVWLVQILTHSYSPPLSDHTWKAIRKKVNKFGIRAGSFDCSMDIGYCARKNWLTSRLVLALPQAFETKSNVTFFSFDGPLRESLLYKWIQERLDAKVTQITNCEQFSNEWLSYPSRFWASEIRVILFHQQQSIPMFFSALSVKFPGRVRFGTVLTNSFRGREIMAQLNVKVDDSKATYIIITPEKIFQYGNRIGEYFSFSSLDKFLKSLYPCLNDIFVLSILVTNIISWLEVIVVQGSFCKRVRRLTWSWIKCNILLIMLWLPIMGVFQLPYIDQLPQLGLKAIRIMAVTDVAALLRKDIAYFSRSFPLLFLLFMSYFSIAGYICFLYKNDEEDDDEEDLWNFAQMRTFQPLLRPADSIIGPFRTFGSDLDFEAFFDVPARPAISFDYIKDLPTWYYHVHDFSCVSSQPNVENSIRQYHTNIDRLSDSALPKETHTLELNASLDLHDLTTMLPNPRSCGQACSLIQSYVNSTPSIQNCHCFLEDGLPHEACMLTKSDCQALPENLSNACAKIPDHHIEPVDSMTDNASSERSQIESPYLKKSRPSVSHIYKCNRETCSRIPDGYLQNCQCVICLEEYTAGILLCGLPCRHVFHQTCIQQWLRRDNHLCPVCRCPTYSLNLSPPPSLHLD